MNINANKSKYCPLSMDLTGTGPGSCEKVTAQMEAAKNQVSAEFSERLAGHESVLRLALNEAEALAWETNYPYLVFTSLAMEKAQAAATWENRQQLLTSQLPPYARVKPGIQDHV
jgi:hypothetical protein